MKHLPYLDGLRGWASLVVLNWHTRPTTDIASPSPLVDFLFSNGGGAVAVFFVLSGRVIALSMLRTPTIKNFFTACIKRFFRLFVPVCGAFFVNWIFQLFGAFNLPEGVQIDSVVGIQAYVFEGLRQPYHLWDIIPIVWGILTGAKRTSEVSIFHGLSVCWTLINELDSSLWIYFLALVVGKVGRLWRPLIFLIYAPALYLSLKINSIPFLFISGMFIAELHKMNVFAWLKQRKWLSYPLQTLLLVAVFIYGVYLNEFAGFLQQQFDSFVFKISPDSFWYLFTDRYIIFRGKTTLVAISLMLLTELSDSLQAILSSSRFQWLGKHSFALYLLHTIFQSTILVHVKLYLATVEMMDAGFLRAIIAYVFNFIVLIPACLVFTRIFDQGSVSIGQYATSGAAIEDVKRALLMIVTTLKTVPVRAPWTSHLFRFGSLDEPLKSELLSEDPEVGFKDV